MPSDIMAEFELEVARLCGLLTPEERETITLCTLMTAKKRIIELEAEVERLRELAREHADLAANNRQEFLDAEACKQAFREVLEAVRPEIAFSWQKDLVKRIDTALATKESDSQKSHGFVYRGRPGLSPPSSPPKESPK